MNTETNIYAAVMPLNHKQQESDHATPGPAQELRTVPIRGRGSRFLTGSVLMLAAAFTPSAAYSASCGAVPNEYQVYLYSDSNYEGHCVAVEIGWYPHSFSFQSENDSISSIRVGRRVKATLFSDAYYGGRGETFYFDSRRLGDRYLGNDAVSSIKVDLNGWNQCDYGTTTGSGTSRSSWKPAYQCKGLAAGPEQVILYRDANFGGDCSVVEVGSYAHGLDLAMENDSISSIKVGSKVIATLFSDANYMGRGQSFPTFPSYSRDYDRLSTQFIGNDAASSLEVRRTCVTQFRTLTTAY